MSPKKRELGIEPRVLGTKQASKEGRTSEVSEERGEWFSPTQVKEEFLEERMIPGINAADTSNKVRALLDLEIVGEGH